ncbi:hypothetical protein AcW1_008583 [Taiwanofungus camphoratus]|nr:hypothetical protein AcW1_008583 [Antrodia cinnamomea]
MSKTLREMYIQHCHIGIWAIARTHWTFAVEVLIPSFFPYVQVASFASLQGYTAKAGTSTLLCSSKSLAQSFLTSNHHHLLGCLLLTEALLYHPSLNTTHSHVKIIQLDPHILFLSID